MTAPTVERAHRGLPVVLADGRRVVIRPLDADDAAALVAAVERADPWDLRRRFMGSPPPVSFLVRHLRAADGVHDAAIGAFTSVGRLVGVAQFDRLDDEPVAELAVEVAHDYQHDGLGTRLLTELSKMANGVGVHELDARYFADNLAIRRLLHTTGQVVSTSYADGEGHTRIDISDVVE